MRKTLIGMVISVGVVLWLAGVVCAQEKMGTPDEAKALVGKAVAYYNAVGKEKAFEEFNKPDGKFTNVKKGLYITVYDLTGTCLASPVNKAMIGKNFYNLKDSNGKYIIRAGLEAVKVNGSGWHEYTWVNPATKKIANKKTYNELVDNNKVWICCGAYLE